MTEWIPVDEKLPEVGENVLVYYKSDNRIEMDKRTGFCYMSGQPVWVKAIRDSVSHWMPLPESPTKSHHCQRFGMQCYTDIDGLFYLDVCCGTRGRVIKNQRVFYCPICGEKSGEET